MENTKIGNKEAIALLVTITFNQIILNVTKTIVDYTESASLLNILYVGLITLIFTCLICYFLNKFPTFDLIDISEYLGGNFLKWVIGILYIAYFIFFSGILLHIFSSCLQIIYFPLTHIFYIILLFVITAVIICNLKYNAIYRSTLIFFPLLIISLIFLFISDINFFDTNQLYPIWGKGIYFTFASGICNMFAFQALSYIFFIPPILKNPSELKNIAVKSIILSCIFLFISIAIILFMFHGFVKTNILMPLYSAVKYIEYGSFFRKMDSIFLLIWLISFTNFLGLNLKFSSNILKKLIHAEKSRLLVVMLSILLFAFAIFPKNYAISTYFSDIVYKYSFFILVVFISFLVLFFAFIKQKIRKWFK